MNERAIVHFMPGSEELSSRKTAREKAEMVAEAFANAQLFGTPLPPAEQLEGLLASLGPRQAVLYNRIIELEHWLRMLIGHELQGKVQAFEASVERFTLQVKYLQLQENTQGFLKNLAEEYPLLGHALRRFAAENLPDMQWAEKSAPFNITNSSQIKDMVLRFREIRTLASVGLEVMQAEGVMIRPYHARLTEWQNLKLNEQYRQLALAQGEEVTTLNDALFGAMKDQWQKISQKPE